MNMLDQEGIASLREDTEQNKMSLETKIICFLRLLNYQAIDFEDLDFANREKFEELMSKEIAAQKDQQVIDVLKEIVDGQWLDYKRTLNGTKNMVLRMDNDDVIGFFEFDSYGPGKSLMSTPMEIVSLVHRLVDVKSYDSILDLCSGAGTFLNECAKLNPSAVLTGFDINPAVSLIAKMKLIISNVQFNMSTCDVLQTPINQKYDLVFTDIPWGMKLTEEVTHDQDMIVEYERKRKNSEWSFIYKAINAMSKDGKAIVIAPSPALYSTRDKDSRAQVVEKGLLEAVYKMPAGTYLGTGMQYNVLIFSYGNDHVKVVDASECYKSIRSKLKVIDDDEIIKMIALNNSEKVREVATEEIKQKDYSLEVSRYLGEANNIELINPKPIKEIGTVLSGFQYTSKTVTELEPKKGNVEVIKVTNIDQGEVDCSNLSSINIPEERIGKYFLRNNDILITAKGTKITIGVVENIEGRKIIPYNNLLVIRLTSKEVLPQYLCSFLCSQTGRSILQSLQTGGPIINITRKTLMDMNVPILEKAKQQEIVDRFNFINKERKKLKAKLANLESDLHSVYEDCLLPNSNKTRV